jgi:hypothetical protein
MHGDASSYAERDCVLVALATRRAAPFYRALGYRESAAYLRKVLWGSGSGLPYCSAHAGS